jgi:hypothetical protein
MFHYTNTHNGTSHTIGWHFIASVDISDVALLQLEADRMVDYLKRATTPATHWDTWSIVLPNGTVYYTANLTTPGNGTHSTNPNMQDWYSTTIALIGLGDAVVPNGCKGRIVARLHTQGALNFTPGLQKFNSSTDSTIDDLITLGLNASTIIPADFYGQQGDIHPLCPVQWNAHTQRKEGS